MQKPPEGMIRLSELSIRWPELLHLKHSGSFTYGADQIWYPVRWKRMAGCGPTSASHLIYYLSRTREDCRALCPYAADTRDGFIKLMQEVWNYVTPGMRGVNRPSILTEGVKRFGQERGVALSAKTMEISQDVSNRPRVAAVISFLSEQISGDLPVAFLNLSNGNVKNLDNWHWVTIVGLDRQTGSLIVYDQKEKGTVDLALWMETTKIGGDFVSIFPKNQDPGYEDPRIKSEV